MSSTSDMADLQDRACSIASLIKRAEFRRDPQAHRWNTERPDARRAAGRAQFGGREDGEQASFAGQLDSVLGLLTAPISRGPC